MRLAFILLFILVTIFANAQKWCPPGAEWVYSFNEGSKISGFIKLTYNKDTLIVGHLCQEIIGKGVKYGKEPYPPGPYFFNNIPPIYTYYTNDTVFILLKDKFEPIYFFNAEVGDTIEGGTYDNINIAKPQFIINNIEYNLVNGINLKTYYATFVDWNPNFYPEELWVMDRAGSLLTYMYPKYSSSDMSSRFCFYRDNEIKMYKRDPKEDCGIFTTGIINYENTITISPNPVSSYIRINSTLNDQISLISICDIKGSILYTLKIKAVEELNDIKLNLLNNGLYLLNIKFNDGYEYTRKFIKVSN